MIIHTNEGWLLYLKEAAINTNIATVFKKYDSYTQTFNKKKVEA
jgi:hypothetical protein